MKGTILVVEDEQAIADLVGVYLRRDGFEVVWVREGEEALRELPRHPVRLVVLDIGLPGIDGFEVCRRVRARTEVPIVMLSAATRRSTGWRASKPAPTTTSPSPSPRAS